MNQTREKIGVTYGSNLTTTGGNALKFYASVRIEVRRIGAVKEGEQVIGNKTRVKVVKNKLAPPFRQAEFEILYGKGVNRDGEVLDLALDRGLVTRSGAWYSMAETQLGQGRIAACTWLGEHPDVRDRLVKQCIAPPVAASDRPKAAEETAVKKASVKGANGKPKDGAPAVAASPA